MENPVLQHLPKTLRILAVVMFAVSSVYALMSLQMTISGVRTTGTIVNTKRNGLYNHYPIVRFQAEDGIEVEIIASDYFEKSPNYSIAAPLPFAVGDEMPVLYLPDSPGEAMIDNFDELWSWPVLTLKLGFGLAFLAVIFGRLRAYYRKRNNLETLNPWYFLH